MDDPQVVSKLREALRTRGYREDGDMMTLAARCLHMAREDRDLINMRQAIIDKLKAAASGVDVPRGGQQ